MNFKKILSKFVEFYDTMFLVTYKIGYYLLPAFGVQIISILNPVKNVYFLLLILQTAGFYLAIKEILRNYFNKKGVRR